jgi:SAM-dependent methyltransferase
VTAFELAYRLAEPGLPPLYSQVRRQLCELARAAQPRRLEVLDVGGRKSHYTIGVPATITISDLPRESSVQNALNLGITDEMSDETRRRRSNVAHVVYDDMTHSALPTASFDCVVAVEVLEHVEEDAAFVREVARVLRPGGTFLMTTPNGDSFPIPHNEDHKRHYRREQLAGLLRGSFASVDVRYAIATGRMRRLGLRSWSARRPLRTAGTYLANVINALGSSPSRVGDRAIGTHHLVAVARKEA